ncbi:MAG: hypothetical protein IPG66_16375 [Hydrogenophilales bacterium]|nr:hypothetical protein [Hydrogenophilales bacterium]
MAFLHINNQPWDDVVSKAPEGCVIIRFSGEGFPPRRPIINNATGLFCNRRIDDLTPDNIDKLMAVLGDDVICENLGKAVFLKAFVISFPLKSPIISSH